MDLEDMDFGFIDLLNTGDPDLKPILRLFQCMAANPVPAPSNSARLHKSQKIRG
jgi:hypothetical protein